MLIKVGITGVSGSGKSVVSRLLEIMGIPVYISDTEEMCIRDSRSLRRTYPIFGRHCWERSLLFYVLLLFCVLLWLSLIHIFDRIRKGELVVQRRMAK